VENRHEKRVSWLTAVSLTALVCVIIFWIAYNITAPRTPGMLSAIELPCSADQEIMALNDGVLYSDGTYLHALDSRGRQIWANLAGSGAGFDIYENRVSVWLGKRMTLLDGATGLPFYNGTMEDEIISAKAGANYVAVLTGAEGNNSISVMTRSGQMIAENINAGMENMTVLDYGFFNNGSLLWILSLDTEGTVPICHITTHRPGRMLTGSISEPEQIIYRLLFRGDKMLAVGTSYIKHYQYTGDESGERVLVYGWYLTDAGGSSASSPLMAFVPAVQVRANASMSDVRVVNASVDKTIRMPFPCFALRVGGDKVYGFNNQYAMAYGLNDLSPATYALPIYAERVFGLTANNAAILSSGNSVYLVYLP